MRSSTGMASRQRTWLSVALFCFGSLLGAGCGGGGDNLSTASVTGKVTRNGQPVGGGTVMFSPKASADKKGPPGKPAAGEVGTDGTFKLTTYKKDDGAIIGKHQITYTPAPIQIDEAQHTENSKPPVNPFAGLMPKTSEVEIKSGSNTVDIELIPDPKAGS